MAWHAGRLDADVDVRNTLLNQMRAKSEGQSHERLYAIDGRSKCVCNVPCEDYAMLL